MVRWATFESVAPTRDGTQILHGRAVPLSFASARQRCWRRRHQEPAREHRVFRDVHPWGLSTITACDPTPKLPLHLVPISPLSGEPGKLVNYSSLKETYRTRKVFSTLQKVGVLWHCSYGRYKNILHSPFCSFPLIWGHGRRRRRRLFFPFHVCPGFRLQTGTHKRLRCKHSTRKQSCVSESYSSATVPRPHWWFRCLPETGAWGLLDAEDWLMDC